MAILYSLWDRRASYDVIKCHMTTTEVNFENNSKRIDVTAFKEQICHAHLLNSPLF